VYVLKEDSEPPSVWARLAAFHLWLGSLDASASGVAGEVRVTPKQATRRLAEGRSLLQWEDLAVDWGQFQQWASTVLTSISRHFPTLAGAAMDAQAVLRDTVMLQRVVRASYEGRSVPQAATSGRESKALGDVLQIAAKAVLRPCLCVQREKLLPLVPIGQWRRGICPVCGGFPDLAYLERELGARWLVCGRCDAQWVFQRLECPYCQCTNQERLSYGTDPTGRYRVYFCDECHSYLKSLDLRTGLAEMDAAAQRMETLDLDRQARQKGFISPESLASLVARAVMPRRPKLSH